MTDALPGTGSAATVTAEEVEALRTQLADARRTLKVQAELSTAEQDRRALERGEHEHRIRNTLALLRSIFTRTVEAADSLEQFALHFEGRFDVLARHQLSPALNRRCGVDLELLIRDHLRNFCFGGDDPRIIVHGPDLLLDADRAQPFGLAIHELVTNAFKFGALANSKAILKVTWTVENDLLDLAWVESGVSMIAAAPTRRGFGVTFIEEALAYQLGAEARLELRPGGISWRIRLPLSGETSIRSAAKT